MAYNVELKNSEQVLHLTSEQPASPGGNHFNVSLLWLRENCSCAKCYSEITHQRKFLISDLDLNTTAKHITVQNDELTIIWDNNHKSNYNLSDLILNLRPTACQPEPVLWTSAKLDGFLGSLTAGDVMLENGKRKLLSDIFMYGVGRVNEVEPTEEATHSLVTSIFQHIRGTLFGTEMYNFVGDPSDDTSYKNQELGLHTDNTYFIHPSGVQVFHSLQPADEGGDIPLVDAFHAASILRSQNKEAYDTLTRVSCEGHYQDDTHHYAGKHKVLELDETTGQLAGVRYNLYYRSPRVQFPSTPSEVKLFYSSLQQFDRLLYLPELYYSAKLKPGQVLLVNNWRVMHGRQAFRGLRPLTGCYLTMGNLMSQARMLKLVR